MNKIGCVGHDCAKCRSMDTYIGVLLKENAKLKQRLKDSPIDRLKNMRAEFQEIKELLHGQQKMLASLNGRIK